MSATKTPPPKKIKVTIKRNMATRKTKKKQTEISSSDSYAVSLADNSERQIR